MPASPRRTPLVVAVATGLVVALTAVTPASAAYRPKVAVAPSPAVAGEKVTITGSLGTKAKRKVVLQRKIGRQWKKTKQATTAKNGRFRFVVPAARGGAVLRVTAPRTKVGGRTHRRVVTKTVRLRTTGQRVSFSLAASATAGQRLTASAIASPARKGRKVQLQIRGAGRWTTVAGVAQNARGRAALPVTAGTPGTHRFRTRLVARKGAPAIVSAVRTIRVHPAPNRLVSRGKGAGGDDSSFDPRLSADGRWVTYTSSARNLAGKVTGGMNVYLTEVSTGRTTLVSRTAAGASGNGTSRDPDISADGRYVTYMSYASDLVTSDRDKVSDILRYDRVTGKNEKVSFVSYVGADDGPATAPSISGNGRYVAYSAVGSRAPELTNGTGPWIYVRDMVAETTSVVGPLLPAANGRAIESSWYPDISADGKWVTFQTTATNLGGPPPGRYLVYLYEVATKTLTRVSSSTAGGVPNDDSFAPRVSGDGRYVTYYSDASDLVPGDTGGRRDVILYDRVTATTTNVSSARGGGAGNGVSDDPFVSDDGTTVVFSSTSSDLVAGDTNGVKDAFAYSIGSGAVSRVAVRYDGRQASATSFAGSTDRTGRLVAFSSSAPYLVPGVTSRRSDVFVRDRAVVR